MTEPEPFRAIAISRMAHALKAQGRSIIHMEFGQPSAGAPPAAIAAAHFTLDTDPMGYWESVPLREAIAARYAAQGAQIDPARITITCGASPALVLALLSSLRPGARVAIARPGYVAYRNTLRALSMEPVEIACDAPQRFQLTAAALGALEPAPDAVILASPANPTGTLIAPDELRAIVTLCRARAIRVISDEIYHSLIYEGEALSVAALDPTAFIVNSFSKYFAMAGWRLGWLVSPQSHVDAVHARVGNLFLTAPSLAQHAGLAAMQNTAPLDALLARYRANRQRLLDALPGLGLSRIAPPDGAFYIWADISAFTQDSLSFCQALLHDTGVATAPGIDFDPVNGHTFMRFSFAVREAETEDAISRLTPWFLERRRD